MKMKGCLLSFLGKLKNRFVWVSGGDGQPSPGGNAEKPKEGSQQSFSKKDIRNMARQAVLNLEKVG